MESLIYHKRSATTGFKSDFSRYYYIRNSLLTIYKNYTLFLLIKYLSFIIIMQIAMSLIESVQQCRLSVWINYYYKKG